MNNNIKFLKEFRKLILLAIPMICAEGTYALMPFMNTIYMGHLSADALAAGGLVSSLFAFIMVLFWGIFSMVSSFTARHEGAQQPELTSGVVKTAVLLAIILSIPVMILFQYAGDVLTLFGQKPNIVILASEYMRALKYSILPDFLLVVLFQFYYGLSKPHITMIFSIVIVPLNLLVNYILIFGKFGIPSLGIAGAGWGSSLCYWLELTSFVLYLSRSSFRHYFRGRLWFHKRHARELILTGLPVGAMWIFEVGFFFVIALFMGTISDTALAAHQIAFQSYMLFFNILYSFSQAVAVRVGNGLGAKRKIQVLHAYLGGLVFALSLACVVALLFFKGHALILTFFLGANFDTASPVSILATQMLMIASLAFVFDSTSYITFASLRSFKDTRYTLGVSIVVYWILIVPTICLGVFHYHIESPLGLWGMLVLGVFLTLTAQSLRFIYQYRKLVY